MDIQEKVLKPLEITKENFFNLPCTEGKRSGTWTLLQLKAFAKKNGLKQSGNKKDLCTVITNYIKDESELPMPSITPKKKEKLPVITITNIYQEYQVKINSLELIKDGRNKFHNFLLKLSPNKLVKDLTNNDLEELFTLYDNYFFDSSIRKLIKQRGEELIVHFGKFRKTKGTAGHCKWKEKGTKCYHTIGFSLPVLSKVFVGEKSYKTENVNGIQVYDQLEALMIVLEHEMIHLIVNIWNEGKNEKDKFENHGKVFKLLAKNIFGHTDTKHYLGKEFEKDPLIHIEEVKKYLEPGMKITTLENGKKIPYTVVNVIKRSNVRRFRASDENNKIWILPMLWVILPEK